MHDIKSFFTDINDGNLAYNLEDDKFTVDKIRYKLSAKHKFDIKSLRFMNQIHKDNVIKVTNKSPALVGDCDAMITNEIGIPLMVVVADCIPILINDRKKGVVAVIHAGRNSTYLEIVKKVVNIMVNDYSCHINDLEAEFGPSINKCCYEVNKIIANLFIKRFGDDIAKNNHIDLQGVNKKILLQMGLTNIKTSTICTKCSKNMYFSYRKDKRCGRFAGIIYLD